MKKEICSQCHRVDVMRWKITELKERFYVPKGGIKFCCLNCLVKWAKGKFVPESSL